MMTQASTIGRKQIAGLVGCSIGGTPCTMLSSWSVTGRSFTVPSRFGIATLDGTSIRDQTSACCVAMHVSPMWSLTDRDEVTVVLDLTGLSASEKVTLTLAGNGLKAMTELPGPHAAQRTLAVAVGDLPPGSYTITATLTGPEGDSKNRRRSSERLFNLRLP